MLLVAPLQYMTLLIKLKTATKLRKTLLHSLIYNQETSDSNFSSYFRIRVVEERLPDSFVFLNISLEPPGH